MRPDKRPRPGATIPRAFGGFGRRPVGEEMTIARAQRRNGLLLGADLALFMAALGAMSTGFLVVYAVGRLGATDELAAWYTAVVLLAQVVANPGLG